MSDTAPQREHATDAILAARVEILQPAIRKSMLSSAVSIAVFGALLVTQSAAGLAIWVGIRVATSAAILRSLARLSKRAPHPRHAIRHLTVLMATSGVVWGVIPLLIRPDEQEWRAVVVLWLFGNQSVVTAVCSASRPVFLAASGSVTLVGAASILLYADSFSLILAGILVLGGVYSVSIFDAMHQAINAAIDGRLAAAASAVSLAEQQRELEAMNRELSRLASRDDLTGLLNRRSFFDHVVDDQGRALDDGWLLSLDLDHFKHVNDSSGHAAGDLVLQIATSRWLRVLPKNALLARTGGDEFAAWFTTPNDADAQRVAQALRKCLGGSIALPDNTVVDISCSIGMTEVRAGELLKDSAARSDDALYRAKRSGRNTIDTYQR